MNAYPRTGLQENYKVGRLGGVIPPSGEVVTFHSSKSNMNQHSSSTSNSTKAAMAPGSANSPNTGPMGPAPPSASQTATIPRDAPVTCQPLKAGRHGVTILEMSCTVLHTPEGSSIHSGRVFLRVVGANAEDGDFELQNKNETHRHSILNCVVAKPSQFLVGMVFQEKDELLRYILNFESLEQCQEFHRRVVAMRNALMATKSQRLEKGTLIEPLQPIATELPPTVSKAEAKSQDTVKDSEQSRTNQVPLKSNGHFSLAKQSANVGDQSESHPSQTSSPLHHEAGSSYGSKITKDSDMGNLGPPLKGGQQNLKDPFDVHPTPSQAIQEQMSCPDLTSETLISFSDPGMHPLPAAPSNMEDMKEVSTGLQRQIDPSSEPKSTCSASHFSPEGLPPPMPEGPERNQEVTNPRGIGNISDETLNSMAKKLTDSLSEALSALGANGIERRLDLPKFCHGFAMIILDKLKEDFGDFQESSNEEAEKAKATLWNMVSSSPEFSQLYNTAESARSTSCAPDKRQESESKQRIVYTPQALLDLRHNSASQTEILDKVEYFPSPAEKTSPSMEAVTAAFHNCSVTERLVKASGNSTPVDAEPLREYEMPIGHPNPPVASSLDTGAGGCVHDLTLRMVCDSQGALKEIRFLSPSCDTAVISPVLVYGLNDFLRVTTASLTAFS